MTHNILRFTNSHKNETICHGEPKANFHFQCDTSVSSFFLGHFEFQKKLIYALTTESYTKFQRTERS